EGSAYRKEGASMLFTSNSHIGSISAGCLETDLGTQAEIILNDDSIHSQIVVYDMRAEDDLGWGRGAGCNGKGHILLERLTSELRKQLLKVYTYLQSGVHVIAIKQLTRSPDPLQTLYMTCNGQLFGHTPMHNDVFIQDAQHMKQTQLK